jgi:uncharacterized protein with PIN domain
VKFIADAMLGRLAKWMRLLGFDVLYYPEINDSQVVKIARQQERTVLTRDTGLLMRRGLKDTIFIKSDEVYEQLAELKDRLNFLNADPMGRCVLCNGTLSRVPRKEEVRNMVPDFVYHNIRDFTKCAACGKIYWEGSHYKRFKEKIEELLKEEHEN